MNENNWLGYEVGDNVYVFTGGSFGHTNVRGPYKVNKVTPTGRITLSNGLQFTSRGWLVGGGSYSRDYLERKNVQDERVATVAAIQRVRVLKQRVNTLGDTLNAHVDVSSKEARQGLAESLEAMAQTLRSFDEEAP